MFSSRPKTLFTWALILILVGVFAKTAMTDVLLAIDGAITPVEQHLSEIGTIVDVTSAVALPLGCSLLAAGIVIASLPRSGNARPEPGGARPGEDD